MQRISGADILKAGVVPEPAFRQLVLARENGVTLKALLKEGLPFRTKVRGIRVYWYQFKTEGDPFRLRGLRACPHGFGNGCQCGYWAVRVVCELGGRSLLYYEPESEKVSGMVTLRGK